MGLTLEQFWSMLPREFHLKHRAFVRAENRQRALVMEHALMTGHFAPKDATSVKHSINVLREYPIKRWLRRG